MMGVGVIIILRPVIVSVRPVVPLTWFLAWIDRLGGLKNDFKEKRLAKVLHEAPFFYIYFFVEK